MGCMVASDDRSSASQEITALVLQEVAADRLPVWGSLWGIPDLAAQVRVCVSLRMGRSLGRWLPARREIRVNSLALSSARVLEEVLCHEAAHGAIHLRQGPVLRAHGPEWQRLMQTAGFAARVRIPLPGTVAVPHGNHADRVYEHRCPVCQSVSYARRPMPRLRCTACRAVGLDGVLEIVRQTGT